MTRNRTDGYSRSAVPWLIGGGLLLVLIWLLARDRQDRVQVSSAAGVLDSIPSVATRLPVAAVDFIRFTEQHSASDATAAHDYTADGLRRLSMALDAVAGTVDVRGGASEMRARADSMQSDPSSIVHARQARDGALLASALLRRLQDQGQPDLAGRVGQVKEAALAIKIDQPLLDQRREVQAFFSQAASAIREMEQRR